MQAHENAGVKEIHATVKSAVDGVSWPSGNILRVVNGGFVDLGISPSDINYKFDQVYTRQLLETGFGASISVEMQFAAENR